MACATLSLPPWISSCGDAETTPTAPVTGSVVGTVSAEGRGLDGVTVALSGQVTTTTATGTYRFDNVAGGNHAVAISGYPSDVTFPSTTATVTISSAGQTARVDFDGTYVRTSVVAGLVSVGGVGLGGVAVELSGPEEMSTETDIAGTFTFRAVRAGAYVVRITGFDPEAVGFDRVEQEIEVEVGETAMADFIGVDLAAENNVLRDLYEATGGASWGDALGWSPDKPVSEWGGVEVDSAGAVTGLLLRDAGLAGKIPPTLGDLSRLKHVNFAGNSLHGDIPAGIFGDTSLVGNRAAVDARGDLGDAGVGAPAVRSIVSFDASDNELSGPIPPTVGQATNLRELKLGSLFGDTSVAPLDVGRDRRGNRLTGPIPPEIGNLSNLEVLDLMGNQLTESIPAELGHLANLRLLWLHDNELTGSIPELGNLANLEGLELAGNQLSGSIPPSLGSMASLEYLHLYGNQLSGPIPAELGDLAKLTRLWLEPISKMF